MPSGDQSLPLQKAQVLLQCVAKCFILMRIGIEDFNRGDESDIYQSPLLLLRLAVYAVWLKYSVLLQEGQARAVPLVFHNYVAFRLFSWLTER